MHFDVFIPENYGIHLQFLVSIITLYTQTRTNSTIPSITMFLKLYSYIYVCVCRGSIPTRSLRALKCPSEKKNF